MSAFSERFEDALDQEPPWWADEAPEPPVSLDPEREIPLHDKALVCAHLCAGSYAGHAWAFDCAAGVADPAGWIEEGALRKDPDLLARALFLSRRMRPLEGKELGVSDDGPGRLVRGQWRSGALAEGLCAVEERSDGSRILHLCCRGTEPASHPNAFVSMVRLFVGYFAWTYPRIEKHAGHFEPLARAAAAYAEDPANRISELVFSGHSLGASAAETLASKFGGGKTPTSLVGFGSPGSGSGYWAVPKRIVSGVSKFAALCVAKARGLGAAVRVEAAQTAALSAPASLALKVQFEHPNDPIPKLGSWLYPKGGERIVALGAHERNLAAAGQDDKLVQGLAAHGALRYCRSVEEFLSSAVDEAPFRRAPEALTALRQARQDASELEFSVDPKAAAAAAKAKREAAASAIEALDGGGTIASLRIRAVGSTIDDPEKIASGRKARKLLARMRSGG